jgi:3-methylfumaryl-CoA hydratase
LDAFDWTKITLIQSKMLKFVNKFTKIRQYSTVDTDVINAWKSKCVVVTRSDITSMEPLLKFASTIQISKGEVTNTATGGIHPASHWFYFAPLTKTSELDTDGYEKEYSPPGFAKRMFAGGEVTYTRTPKVDESLVRITGIPTVTMKNGKSGQLCFVAISHEIKNVSGDLLIKDVQNFVYRNSQLDLQPIHNNPRRDFSNLLKRSDIPLDEVLLFRFSSLTWNSHKIHYDKDWAKIEGYPAPLVHGPLSATLLLDLANTYGKKIKVFSYQALRPLFCNTKVHVLGETNGDTVKLWVEDANDQNIKYMEAKVQFETTIGSKL